MTGQKTRPKVSSAPEDLRRLAGPVEIRLAEYLDSVRDTWVEVDDSLGQALDSLRSLVLAPAKRLRAAFCHWGATIGGGAPEASVIDAGVALELLQAFALIHDDVMDRSARRRGQPATHVGQAEIHRNSEWFGDADHYGEGAAVLIGNLAHVFADELLCEAAGSNQAVWQQWNALRTEVNLGQFLDLNGAARRSRDPETAARILHLKSATYTIERPLLMGAGLAGTLADWEDDLRSFGAPLGQAFQLRDDLLGAVGDPAITGKPVGDDLREGKPTPLLAEAHQKASPAQRSVLDGAGERDSLTDEDVGAMLEVLTETGALATIEARIVGLVDIAETALGRIDQRCDADLDALSELARFVTTRSH